MTTGGPGLNIAPRDRQENVAVGAEFLRTWRATRYLLVSTMTAILCVTTLLGLIAVLFFCVFLVGVLALPETVLLIRGLAGMQRRRAATMLGAPIPEQYVPLHDDLRPARRVRRAVTDPASRRDLGWLASHAISGFLPGIAVVVLWVMLSGALGVAWLAGALEVAGSLWAIPTIAKAQAQLDQLWLKPSPKARLAERVEQLATTRAEALDAHGAELQRIERDLHDGTQARLVSVGLRLGIAEQKVRSDPGAASRLVREARDTTNEALTELRQVVRAIHPPILSDRGLAGAVNAVAANSAIPVTVGTGDVGRLPAAVEAAAYFVITEALTNMARHSGAGEGSVHMTREGDNLMLQVRDDGHGGADETRGSGLAGIRRRVAAFDGHTHVNSQAGGPTVLHVVIPCAW